MTDSTKSSPKGSSNLTKWLAAFLPVAGVALLMVRGELRSESSTKFIVPITGYDPRDLIHGQYIRFRFDWPDISGECHGPECCLCLEGPPMVTPRARRMECNTETRCDALVLASEVDGGQRYLVPEHSGGALEDALRDLPASVELQCSDDRRVAFGELYLDGRPWREVVPH